MEAVGQLTGGIAHDFNNMLAVVLGGLELAQRRSRWTTAISAARHIDNAMEGANRAAALTRRLLAFSRAEPLKPEAIEPGALIAGMSDLLDRTLGDADHASTTQRRRQRLAVWVDRAPARKCDAQPRGQRARRDGRARQADDRHRRARRSRADEIGDCAGGRLCHASR